MAPDEILPRECGRVRLRRLRAGDLPAFQRYRHDPDVGRWQGWTPWPDAEAGRFLATMAAAGLFSPGEWCQLAIAATDTDELLGDIGLKVSSDGTEAEIGFTLGRESQGRGLGTEAVSGALAMLFERTGVTRVLGITDARNAASIALLERVGLLRTGSREAEFRGETCTELVYALSRPGREASRP